MTSRTTETHLGRVFQLNRKPEVATERGLPKTPIPEVRVTREGMDGDFNRYRREVKGNDSRLALLIVPVETLHQLNDEGWPVRPGDLGENITSEGVAYREWTPGRRFRIGEVLIQVAKPCDPCDNLYLLSYVGAARGPEFIRTMLGRRGWYAQVLEEGRIHQGDSIRPVDDG